jgi:hypothetical protein
LGILVHLVPTGANIYTLVAEPLMVVL